MFSVSIASIDCEKAALAQLRYDTFVLQQYKYKTTADHANRKLWDVLDDVAIHLCLRHDSTTDILGSLR